MDKFDLKATELLPCCASTEGFVCSHADEPHEITCPAYYRSVVASELRRDKETVRKAHEPLVLGPGDGSISTDEIVTQAVSIIFSHARNCAVHSPSLRPCSCGLETRARDAIVQNRAEIAKLREENDKLKSIA
jgi:hypothetical protein